MKRSLYGLLGLAASVCILLNCRNEVGGKAVYPSLKSARALSTHYVLVEYNEPASAVAEDPANYMIVGPEKEQLAVSAVTLSADRTEATLATAEQAELQYQIAMGSTEEFLSLGRTLPVGTLGFFGTSQREPFLESAVSLSSTEILLTFSQQMDRETAETAAFYEIADPDGNTDIDIRVSAAALQPDYITVILTTTPQSNIEYVVRVTNVKRRFTCEDEGRVFLDNASQGTTCAGNYRPKDSQDSLTSFVLTSRTQIDRNFPLDPNATGLGASVGLEANGAGVRRPLCNGGTTGIDGANGSDPDEELIFTADRPELADNIVLGMRFLDFLVDMPVLFVSSEASPNFDIVINTPEIRAAFNAGVSNGDIVFANMPSLADGLRIDAFKLRETNGETWVHSVCGLATNRRLIDPTRNTAGFFGIPPIDTDGPRVVRVQSTSDTELVVYFSEPLNSDAANPANFTITPDLTVIDARLGAFDTQVILTTSPQHVDVEYMVTVMNVQDKAGNLIQSSANSSTFTYGGGPAGLGADALPRVAGAASTGNTGVLVTFTKPMGPSAEVAGNYVIVQQNVNPEVGALVVLSAAFLTPQQDAVQLTTISQNEVTYLLRAVNVRDLSGNQIAPPQLLVDPATALFPGTPFSCGTHVCDGGFNAGSACDPDQSDPDADCKDGADDGTCSRPPCEPPDQDGDGLSDHVELRGHIVFVELTNGQVIEREVTSDIRNPDTDDDGLTDAEEKRIGCDPRKADTDDDQLTDWEEYNFVYSNQNDQDSDDDGIDDLLEVDFFKTNALLADSDGDGFDDDQELYVMNRDPRIADLPSPRLSIGSVKLQLQEEFSFTDENGRSQNENSSSTSTLSASTATTTTNKVGFTFGVNGKVGIEGGYESGGAFIKASGEVGANLGFSFEHTAESARTAMQTFESSLSKGVSVTGSSSSTRQVTGGRIDAMVTLGNLSNVAFSLTNLEITVSAPDPVDRTTLVPIATLIPNSSLVTGKPVTYNIGVLDGSGRGPVLFTSRDVFPALVEDLMRDPRGLVFEFANYDLSDEFGRNFAFASQTARDRTVGLVVDSGDGDLKRYFVAYAPVRFAGATCDPAASPGCDIVGGLAGFADAGVPPFGGLGVVPGLPLEYILEEVLQLRRSRPVVTPVWMSQPAFLPPEIVETGVCAGGTNDGGECDPSLGNADCDGGICNNIVAPDGILVGHNGTADSIAVGDDVQLIPAGIDGLPEDATVISAGEDGVLQTPVRSDDTAAVITGYATTRTCNGDTPSSIQPGPNGDMETLRDPFSDDLQNVPSAVILPGANGFIDTAPAGDDVFVGPGIPCDDNGDCFAAPGACDGQESLFRFHRRARGQFGRAWAVLVPDDNLIGLDFRKVVLRPGEVLNLGFVQDLDRDGLISDVEAMFGSSDTRQDSDGDRLDDYSEVRVGWEVGVDGQSIRRVFPDPRFADTDGDGLADREEQDFRRVQCACNGGANDGKTCTLASADCAGSPCVNVADNDLLGTPCGSNASASRTDPRLIDTDSDLVTDAEEVLGWLTQMAVIDPSNLIIAGVNRMANATACPQDVCAGGSMHGRPCHFDRDCGTLRVCTQGVNDGIPCVNDIECQGPTPGLSGLCDPADDPNNLPADPLTPTPYEGVCQRTGCDDVQVVPVGTSGLDPRGVVVAPGKDGVLHADTLAAVAGDLLVAAGNLRAATTAVGDDQQIAPVDPARVLDGTPLGRLIVRPGINGVLDTLQPSGDDVVAAGQFIQTTNPLKRDTDQDQISDGFERVLGSDPRLAADGGLLADRDGDGLTDQQERLTGWAISVDDDGVAPLDVRTVFSNPNVPDSDSDGLPDLAEFRLRTDPKNQDTDGDGLSDSDELTNDQLAELNGLNGLFPGFVFDPDASKAYGTSPLACDSDHDLLTDSFEILEGFNVTLRSDDGIVVFHVHTDPANADTDFDGLSDGAEYKHRVQCSTQADCAAAGSTSGCISGVCAAFLPTDPTSFDSDRDGRKDGDECDVELPPPSGCAPLTQPVAHCGTNPLVPDKRVTIRFVELILDRDQGGDTNDLSWQFGAQKSNETFPGTLWAPPLTTTRDDCEPPGVFESECGGHITQECILREGDHVVFGSDALGFCADDSGCANLLLDTDADGVREVIPGQCTNGFCNACFSYSFLPPPFDQLVFCLPTGDGKLDNERTFALRPGQGILIYGKVLEFDDCPAEGPLCAGGPNDGASCGTGPADCCRVETGVCFGTVCSGGPNNGATCVTDDDCRGTVCGECQFQNLIGHHMDYFKTLSFESLTQGFTVDTYAMRDPDQAGDQFQMTIVVEIIVE